MVTDFREVFNKISDRFTEDQVRHLFRKMTESVEVCHNANIIHRDVKMENFLVDLGLKDDIIIKLSDFGYACKHLKCGA